jgi:hypothetical protein
MALIWRRLSVLALLILASVPRTQATDLTDHGTYSEYFYDAQTGLYWCDPAVFAAQPRVLIDLLAQYSTVWDWATSEQIDALVGRTAPAGVTLETVIGLRQFTIGNGGPRWIGFHAGAGDPNGWLIQSEDSPDFRTVSASGFQGLAENWNAGAWLVAATDPVVAPRLVNLGDADQYFHDLGTDLYWCDPATFVGQTRDQVVDWLTANSDWRWATAAEVYALLGKMSADDGLLITVLGASQFTIGNGGPRWIGYYAQSAQPDGILVQSDFTPSFHLLTNGGTQGGVVNWNPGAWVVSDLDPTPVKAATWGAVKAGYR